MRTDARVTLLERTNLRYLGAEQLPGGAPVDLVTLDLSFISVLKVLPAVCGLLAPGGALLVLIKPQFEAGRAQVRPYASAHLLCALAWLCARLFSAQCSLLRCSTAVQSLTHIPAGCPTVWPRHIRQIYKQLYDSGVELRCYFITFFFGLMARFGHPGNGLEQ